MYKLSVLLVGTLLALLLISCRDEELKRMPDTLPDISGSIINLSGTDNTQNSVILTVSVKTVEGTNTQVNQASISVSDETLIEDAAGEHLAVDALREGQEVEIWLVSDALKSLTERNAAKAIRILKQ